MKLTESELLFREGDAPAIHIVLEGKLSLEPMDGGTPTFGRAGRLHRRLRDAGRTRPDRLAGTCDARRRGAACRSRSPLRPARRSHQSTAGPLQLAAARSVTESPAPRSECEGCGSHSRRRAHPWPVVNWRHCSARCSSRALVAQQPALRPGRQSVPGVPIPVEGSESWIGREASSRPS